MHFSVEYDPLAKALAVLVLDLQAAERASPLLNSGVRHWGCCSSSGLWEDLDIYHLAGTQQRPSRGVGSVDFRPPVTQ